MRPKGTGKYGEPTKTLRIPTSLQREIEVLIQACIYRKNTGTLDKWLKRIGIKKLLTQQPRRVNLSLTNKE